MSLTNLLKVAWRAVLLNKTRTLLTMLGIIIGVASVIAMLAIGEGSKKSIQESISSMGANMINIRPGSQMFGGVMDQSEMQSLQTIGQLRSMAFLLNIYLSGTGNWRMEECLRMMM